MTNYRSKKFALAALALLALAVLCWFRKIDGGQFIQGLTVSVGTYMAANWAQKRDQAKAAA
jgi:hypothetical protein